ncbi:MAG: hypothetical protein AAGG01_20695, partial [Planctomycetota bacterium]
MPLQPLDTVDPMDVVDAPQSRGTPEAAPKHKLRVPRARRGETRLWVGTRKGLFSIESDAARAEFAAPVPHWIGSTVFHVVADPRDRDTVVAAIRTPDGVPTIATSRDAGRRWTFSDAPPRFVEQE